MSHLFDIAGRRIPTSLIARGDAVSEMITFDRYGDQVTMGFTPVYFERLRQVAQEIRDA
jgi:hypothetical protein